MWLKAKKNKKIFKTKFTKERKRSFSMSLRNFKLNLSSFSEGEENPDSNSEQIVDNNFINGDNIDYL